jgi:hypothetical protein
LLAVGQAVPAKHRRGYMGPESLHEDLFAVQALQHHFHHCDPSFPPVFPERASGQGSRDKKPQVLNLRFCKDLPLGQKMTEATGSSTHGLCFHAKSSVYVHRPTGAPLPPFPVSERRKMYGSMRIVFIRPFGLFPVSVSILWIIYKNGGFVKCYFIKFFI